MVMMMRGRQALRVVVDDESGWMTGVTLRGIVSPEWEPQTTRIEVIRGDPT